MEFKILGFGCCNCDNLAEIAKNAVKELGIDAIVIKVTDIGDIARHGILSTLGLIDNWKVKYSGKPLPSLDKVKELIKGEMAKE